MTGLDAAQTDGHSGRGRTLRSSVPLVLTLAACLGEILHHQLHGAASQDPPLSSPQLSLSVPLEYFTLNNGLRVVLSVDRTTPVAAVAVYYHVGFRNEPRNRTGFAHLFEHMMFQGSENLDKMAFNRLVQSNGDVLNGSTRFDFTNYFEVVSSNIRRGHDPDAPDVSEPRQEREKRFIETYARAPRPALALGYHAPPRDSDVYYALALIDQALAQGKSRLDTTLVYERGLTDDVSATMNALGNRFNIEGPTLYTISLFHDQATATDTIVRAIDAEIERLQREPLDVEALRTARLGVRSALYDTLEGFVGFGRADLLAFFALFFDEPQRINRLDERFAAVTPELILTTAREYLRPTNRTILVAQPGAAPPGEKKR